MTNRRLAKHKVLKDLGIVGNDGKLNDDAIQEHTWGYVKELLSPDLLESVTHTYKRSCFLGSCGGDLLASSLGFVVIVVILVDVALLFTL